MEGVGCVFEVEVEISVVDGMEGVVGVTLPERFGSKATGSKTKLSSVAFPSKTCTLLTVTGVYLCNEEIFVVPP